VILLILGVVIGMAVAWVRGIDLGWQIGLIVFALVLVAVGLAMNRKFRREDTR